MSTKQTFIKGAKILTLAGIVVKIIGALNKVFITRLLGEEGIGLYQMAYPIYSIATSLATAGIPVAISILVAEAWAKEDSYEAKRILKVASVTLVFLGGIVALLLYMGSDWLISHHVVYDVRAIYAIRTLAPAIPVVAIMSCYRGYFQGKQNMLPTGISQTVEQIVRVVTMFVLAYALLPYGLEIAAAGATFATLPGAVGALLVLLYFWYKDGVGKNNRHFPTNLMSTREILKRLCILAIPVSVANIMMPLMAGIDSFIVPYRLGITGMTQQEVTSSFGYLTGMANSLVNLPVIVTAALAASLVPAISEARASHDNGEISMRAGTAFTLGNIFTIPAFLGLFALATPISHVLYGTPHAGGAIAALSISIVFLGYQQISTAILQGLGHTMIPMVNLAVSMIVKVGITYYLTAMPNWGIQGAALGTDAVFLLAFLLNLFFVYRYTWFRFRVGEMLQIIGISSVMALIAYGAYHGLNVLLGQTVSLLLAILIGMSIYIVGIMGLGILSHKELEKIPFIGVRILKLQQKLRRK